MASVGGSVVDADDAVGGIEVGVGGRILGRNHDPLGLDNLGADGLGKIGVSRMGCRASFWRPVLCIACATAARRLGTSLGQFVGLGRSGLLRFRWPDKAVTGTGVAWLVVATVAVADLSLSPSR